MWLRHAPSAQRTAASGMVAHVGVVEGRRPSLVILSGVEGSRRSFAPLSVEPDRRQVDMIPLNEAANEHEILRLRYAALRMTRGRSTLPPPSAATGSDASDRPPHEGAGQ